MTFTTLANSIDDESYAWIESISSSSCYQLQLTVETGSWNDAETRQKYLIGFPSIDEYSCRLGSFASMQVVSEHPVLWSHNEVQENVYFSNRPADPFHIIGAAFEAHKRAIGRWRSFSDFWYATPEYLEAGHGFLFEAPRPLSEIFCSAIGDALKMQRLPGCQSVSSLRAFFFDDQFVVAETVEINRIES